MGAMRTYKVTVEVEVEVRTDDLTEVQAMALTKATQALADRSRPVGRDAFTKAVRSIRTQQIA